jgi:hypothetical protein
MGRIGFLLLALFAEMERTFTAERAVIERACRRPSAAISLPKSDTRPQARDSPQGKATAMSIAVMNRVRANSPTSGKERLVLLALAGACSRDNSTGCWPSAATIAPKANISDRTVRAG